MGGELDPKEGKLEWVTFSTSPHPTEGKFQIVINENTSQWLVVLYDVDAYSSIVKCMEQLTRPEWGGTQGPEEKERTPRYDGMKVTGRSVFVIRDQLRRGGK